MIPEDVDEQSYTEMMTRVPKSAILLKTYPWNGKRCFDYELTEPSEKFKGAGVVIFQCTMKLMP